jgi:hypothetical protein
MLLKTQIAISIAALETAASDLGSPSFTLRPADDVVLNDGTGVNQAQKIFSDTRTIAASANDDLDLAGSLTNAFGQVISFTAIKAVYIKASTANVNNLVVGGAPTNTFVGRFGAATHTIALRPGDRDLQVTPGTGWAVVAGTGDILRIANGGAGSTVDYDIIIVGI